MGRFTNRPAVDPDLTALCHTQVSLEPKGCQQINGPLRGGFRLSVTGKFFLIVPAALAEHLVLDLCDGFFIKSCSA